MEVHKGLGVETRLQLVEKDNRPKTRIPSITARSKTNAFGAEERKGKAILILCMAKVLNTNTSKLILFRQPQRSKATQ